MNPISTEDQERFAKAADAFIAAYEEARATNGELDETVLEFIEWTASLLDQSEAAAIHCNGRIFFPDVAEDEEGEYVAGIQWIADTEIMRF